MTVYASPDGSARAATPTIATPWSLAMALTSTRIVAGATISLRGGTYAGAFTSTIGGTQASPITIRSYTGETAIIDGSLTINGADTVWEDIAVCYTGWTTRRTEQSGSTPSDLPLSNNAVINGPRTIVRRCTLHDLAGPGFWTSAVDGIIEDCLFYNNGWSAPDRGHGHGLYTQNLSGTKMIRRCVFAGGYSDFSIHAYSESGSLQGFDVVDCVSIGKRVLFGGLVPVDRLAVTRGILWGGSLQTGYGASVQNGSAVLTDTILANGATRITAGNWTSLTETGTNTTTGDRVLVAGGLVVVLNESQAASVAAPIAGTYRNAQNPAESVTLAQGEALPMTGWTVATPIGAAAPVAASAFPQFGCFVVTP